MMMIALFGGKNEFYSIDGITRDIVIKGVHSHNDYWRKIPLIDAIKAGCISVEADVWLENEESEVYVGHSLLSLENGKTFKKMYIEKIFKILKEANRIPIFGSGHRSGVFSTNSGQTLFLFVDFKTDGKMLYNRINKEVEILDKEGWLTWYDKENDKLIWGAVTVIATGGVYKEDVVNSERRVVFFDGELWSDGGGGSDIDFRISPIASGSLGVGIGREIKNELSKEEVKFICEKIVSVHEKGVMVRIWDTPGWPNKLRESVWDDLEGCGVDLLNVDDLKAMVSY